MSDWLKPDRSASGLPHPNSPASGMNDWSSASVPHPNSPAGKQFDWSSSGIPHPNSPAGQHVTHAPQMTMRQRFVEVLKLTPNHMAPELAAQFRAMLTPSSIAMIAGTFTALAVSQAFGIGEIVDLILLVVGAFFVGMAVFTAAKDIVECVQITVKAKTAADLDRAAGYLAQAVAILGVVAFFALLAKVGEKFGSTSSAEEGSAGSAANDAAETPAAQPSKKPVADQPAERAPTPKTTGPQLRSGLGSQWLDESGNPRWPPNNGAAGPENSTILQPGTTIDRYGGAGGKFASTPEASYEARSMPYDPATLPYQQYEVVKPLPAMESQAAPWFDEPGGAPQYRFDSSVRDLVDQGFLKPK